MKLDPFSRPYVTLLRQPRRLEAATGPTIDYKFQVQHDEIDFNEHRGFENFTKEIKAAMVKLIEEIYGLRVEDGERFPGIKIYHVETLFKNGDEEVFEGEVITVRTGLLMPLSGLHLTQLVRASKPSKGVVLTSVSNYCLVDKNRPGRNLVEVAPYFTLQV